jgi:hypothetical protein
MCKVGSPIASAEVAAKFASYPASLRERLMFLRQLVLDTATDMPGIGEIEETLKWGEPSYLCKKGSTIRIGSEKASPQNYAMYFI